MWFLVNWSRVTFQIIIIINMIRLIIIHNINTVQRRGHWTSMGVECNHHGVFYLVLLDISGYIWTGTREGASGQSWTNHSGCASHVIDSTTGWRHSSPKGKRNEIKLGGKENDSIKVLTKISKHENSIKLKHHLLCSGHNLARMGENVFEFHFVKIPSDNRGFCGFI